MKKWSLGSVKNKSKTKKIEGRQWVNALSWYHRRKA